MSFRILGVLAVLVLLAPGAAALGKQRGADPDYQRSGLCVDGKIPPDVPPNVAIGVDCGPLTVAAGASGSGFDDAHAYLYVFFSCQALNNKCPEYAIYMSLG